MKLNPLISAEIFADTDTWSVLGPERHMKPVDAWRRNLYSIDSDSFTLKLYGRGAMGSRILMGQAKSIPHRGGKRSADCAYSTWSDYHTIESGISIDNPDTSPSSVDGSLGPIIPGMLNNGDIDPATRPLVSATIPDVRVSHSGIFEGAAIWIGTGKHEFSSPAMQWPTQAIFASTLAPNGIRQYRFNTAGMRIEIVNDSTIVSEFEIVQDSMGVFNTRYYDQFVQDVNVESRRVQHGPYKSVDDVIIMTGSVGNLSSTADLKIESTAVAVGQIVVLPEIVINHNHASDPVAYAAG